MKWLLILMPIVIYLGYGVFKDIDEPLTDKAHSKLWYDICAISKNLPYGFISVLYCTPEFYINHILHSAEYLRDHSSNPKFRGYIYGAKIMVIDEVYVNGKEADYLLEIERAVTDGTEEMV